VQDNKRFKDISVMIDLEPNDKLRLKEFMKQELHYYNSLVEGLGPRTRTFPETILGLHKDWEQLWSAIAVNQPSMKLYERAAADAQLPEALEPHRRMLLGRDTSGKRFLDERMFNIMSLAATPALLHPLVRRAMATLILEFYKDQAAKLIKRNDEAFGDEDLYDKPIDLLSVQDLVTKRHLQIPRAALNDVRYIEKSELTELYTPYSDNPIKIAGHDLESNNHWNQLMIHQQPGREVTAKDAWIVDIRASNVPYWIKYQDVEQPTTGKLFAIAKRKSFQ
jgi:hypothetical protein